MGLPEWMLLLFCVLAVVIVISGERIREWIRPTPKVRAPKGWLAIDANRRLVEERLTAWTGCRDEMLQQEGGDTTKASYLTQALRCIAIEEFLRSGRIAKASLKGLSQGQTDFAIGRVADEIRQIIEENPMAPKVTFTGYRAPEGWKVAYDALCDARDRAEHAVAGLRQSQGLYAARTTQAKFCLRVWNEFLMSGEITAKQSFPGLTPEWCDYLASTVAKAAGEIISATRHSYV